jgi:hypothetical protein
MSPFSHIRLSVAGFCEGGPASIPDHVGFLVDNVALGQVFSGNFFSPASSYSTNRSIFINHPVIDAIYVVSIRYWKRR